MTFSPAACCGWSGKAERRFIGIELGLVNYPMSASEHEIMRYDTKQQEERTVVDLHKYGRLSATNVTEFFELKNKVISTLHSHPNAQSFILEGKTVTRRELEELRDFMVDLVAQAGPRGESNPYRSSSEEPYYKDSPSRAIYETTDSAPGKPWPGPGHPHTPGLPRFL